MNDTYIMTGASYYIDQGKPVVVIFSRDFDDKFKTYRHEFRNFKPYFYCPANEINTDLPYYAKYVGEPIIDAFGREIVKVETQIPSQVANIRDLFSFTDMSDFLFDKRFLVDHHIKYAYKIDSNGTPYGIDINETINPRILYYDIEIAVKESDPFPNPLEVKLPVCMIQVGDSYTGKKLLFTNGIPQTSEPDHIACSNEYELFELFLKHIENLNPDLITGWFTSNFDLPYLLNRSKILGINFDRFARIGHVSSQYEQKFGTFRNRAGGRSILDMMEAYKKFTSVDAQRESYSLKTISSELGFSYKDYGPILQNLIERQDYKTFLEYGRNDIIALENIEKKSGVISFYENFRKRSGCTLDDTMHITIFIDMMLLHGGIKPMPRKNYVEDPNEKKFKGAVVHETHPGIHEKILSIDMASLYPNIISGFDLSPDIDKFIPKMIKSTLDERERLRGECKKYPDNKQLYYAQQFTKIANNSYYGYLGSKSSRMYKKEIASEITRRGRELNLYLKEKAESEGLSVIAGDSIAGDTLLKIYDSSKKFRYIKIQDLFTSVDTTSLDGKEYNILKDVYVESIDNNGKVILDKVKCVMRHKCNKQMFRINFTNQLYIDATEDHSIYVYLSKQYNGYCQQINRLTTCNTNEIGKKFKSIILKRVSIHENVMDMHYDKKFYEYLGYHIGDGSISFKENKITKVTNSFCGHKSELKDYFIDYLINKNFIEGYSDDRRNNGCVSFLKSIKFGDLLYSLIGHSENKHFPNFIFTETKDHICDFLRGYFSADGSIMKKNGDIIIKLSSVNKDLINNTRELLYSVGIPSNYFRENKENSYKGKSSGTHTFNLIIGDMKIFSEKIGFLQSYQMNKIKSSSKDLQYKVEDKLDWAYSNSVKIHPIEYDDYVYDLTTEKTHRFFANNVLCHNTDSIFIKGVQSVEEGKKLEIRFNKYLEDYSIENKSLVTFKLKFEKFFKTLMFIFKKDGTPAKKKYIGCLIWEEGKDKFELYDKGSELTRSDISRITKEIMGNFLNYILMENDTAKASAYIKEMYTKVKEGKVSAFDISIPKAVRTLTGNDNVYKRGMYNTKQYLHHTINEGEKPRLIYMLGNPDVFCIDEDITLGDWESKIDWDTMLEKNVTGKIQRYLEASGLDWESLIHGQKSLFDYL